MIKLFDRVKVNIPTTGTGDITFGAAASTAFLTPAEAGVSDGDEVRYFINDGLDFEEGVGLIKDTVATMERSVTKSKIGGVVGTSPMNLSGTAVLALSVSAADIGDVRGPSGATDGHLVVFDGATGKLIKSSGKTVDKVGDMLASNNLSDLDSVDAALANLGANLAWYARGIGEIVYIDTSIAGVSVPPQSHSNLVYIELTAGKTGSGAYNNGKLTSESVSGAAPLTVATAVIDVSGSPINGKTVSLINTEGRILRPSETAGTLQNDQDQKITGYIKKAGNASLMWSATSNNDVDGAFEFVAGGATFRPGTESNSTGAGVTFDSSRVVRAGDETRMKNIGVTAYMRVK